MATVAFIPWFELPGCGTSPSFIQLTVCLNIRITRSYRLGQRQVSIDRTYRSILDAARELLANEGPAPSVRAIAERAGVSRLTIYSRFGTRAGLLAAVAPHVSDDETDDLRPHFEHSCATWARNPPLFRRLRTEEPGDAAHRIAEHLAAGDGLRPGCSIKEAEDVIAALSSFAVFDRLHKDGRRPPAAVVEILLRLARAILA